MSNPLAIFRKYQKVLLVVFGVALMVVFTVGSIVSQWVAEGPAVDSGETVVTMKGGSFNEAEMQAMRANRYRLLSVMQTARQLAAQNGAQPRNSLVIPNTMNEASLLSTAVLAKRARDLGIRISDESIVRFLEQYSEGTLTGADYLNILRSVTQNQMPERQFLDAMRRELLAVRYQLLFEQGLLPTTPAAAWQYFNRLNRQLSFEAVPFRAEDYLAQVDEPSDAEVVATYEAGKERYPSRYSTEPGFRRMKKVAIQWVRADLEPYLEEAMAEITDEQVRTYYEANKEEFRNIDLSSFDEGDSFGIDLPDDVDLGDDSANGLEEATDDEAAEIEPGDLPDDTPSENGSESVDSNPADRELNAPEAESEGEAADAEAGETELDVDESDESDAATPAPNDGSQRIQPIDDPNVTLVTALQENEATETVDQAVDTAEEASENATEAAESVETEASDAASEASNDDAAAPAPSETQADVPTADDDAPLEEETAAEVTEDDLPADDSSADDEENPLGTLPEDAGGAGSKSEFKPLEEVAESIRQSLAAPVARERLNRAVSSMRDAMSDHYGKFLAWESDPDSKEEDKPGVPDLSATANSFGFTVGRTPLLTILELIEDDPISGERRFEISSAFEPTGVSFAQRAFSDDLNLYQIKSIRGSVRDVEYLYWKVDEIEESIPELSEVRDEVVRAIKMQKAYELAAKAAKEAADKMQAGNETPSQVFEGDANRKVVTAESTTWMTGANLPGGEPRRTEIDGLKYIDDEFMKAVFSLDANQATVAPNADKSVAYAVMVTKVETDEEQLKQRFMLTQAAPFSDTDMLARIENVGHLRAAFTEIEDELEIDWKRDPMRDRAR